MKLERGVLGYGRSPGPLGSGAVLGAAVGPPEKSGKAAIKIFEPEPAMGWDPDLRMEDYAGKPLVVGTPTATEVRQGRTGNCPVVATLAAQAHAMPGSIIFSTRAANVEAQVIDTGEPTPKRWTMEEETILYNVRFKFGKEDPVEVTGLLWTRRGKPEYASSTEDAVWVSILEKAYVVAFGGNSYQTIFAKVTPHEAITNMLGPVVELWMNENPSNLKDVLKQAPHRPTIADTLTQLPPGLKVPAGIIAFHTYAVLKLVRDTVTVCNPLDGKTIPVPLATFRQVFESVNQLRP